MHQVEDQTRPNGIGLADLERVIQKTLCHCRANDWAGHDPYDALNSRLLTIFPALDKKVVRLTFIQALKRFPINLRRLLLVPKTRQSKGLALFLSSVLKLQQLGWLRDEELPKIILDQLLASRSPDTRYWCWGYSFPWQTRTLLVARGEPNLVCTTFAADALLDAYEELGQSNLLDIALSAGDYLINELYYTDDANLASFRYPSPTAQAKVHNANFLASALLGRLYQYSGRDQFGETALTVTRYSASKQREDGSWPYGEQPTQSWIDNFHTGYNLMSLATINRTLGISEFEPHIRRGFQFYRNHFFRADGAVRYFHNQTYPIDIHCVAQSILTLLAFQELDAGAMRLVEAIYAWTMKHMWNEAGFFYYRVLRTMTIRTDYMRWSQAWILLALVTLAKQTWHGRPGASQGKAAPVAVA